MILKKRSGWLYTAMAVILIAALGVPVFAESDGEKATRNIFAMDTYMSLQAYGETAEKAVEEAVAEIHRLDALLSTGREDSEVCRLNAGAGGQEAVLSEDTAFLTGRSLELYEETGGAFDITVYPLMKLWGFAGGEFHLPTEEELQEALELVGADQLAFDRSAGTLSFAKEGVEIDFGGIAKGYTSGRVMDVFRENGVKSALVSLGGNVQALGSKPDGSKWRVAIQNPDKEGPYLGILDIADQAVITSGGYERYFEENGTVYHHILDPETGWPADRGLVSVTVVSSDGTYADGLSTSLFVMGEEKAEAFWREHSDLFQMVLLTDGGELLATDGLKGSFQSDLPIRWISG